MIREWGKGRASALAAGGQKKRSHARRQAHANRVHRRLHVLHRVVDREAGGNASPRRIDVQEDVALGVVRLEEQHLRDDDVGDVVIHRSPHEDDAIHEEARKDVVAAFAARRALDDIRRIDGRHLFSYLALTIQLRDLISLQQPAKDLFFGDALLDLAQAPAFCNEA
jgi:hypothetical protein